MSKRRPYTTRIKKQLYLKCGRIDMYSMEKYAKCKLELHHDPPFRKTHHTIYEESYLLSNENHIELHKLELDDHDEYDRRMGIIKQNKKILEKTRNKKS